jgi:hypothetical protein
MQIKLLKSNFIFNRRQLICQWILVGIFVAMNTLPPLATCRADFNTPMVDTAAKPKAPAEYQVKAVYLYNFLMFVEWPEEKSADPNNSIVIGILGKDPFGKSFDIVNGKIIKSRGKKLQVKRLGVYKKELDLTQCDLLFICSSEKKNLEKITKSLKTKPVLTVADTKGFLQAGGMINLIISGGKVKWEINMTPLSWSKLRPHAQFLRIAKRVVQIPKLIKREVNGKEKE